MWTGILIGSVIGLILWGPLGFFAACVAMSATREPEPTLALPWCALHVDTEQVSAWAQHPERN
jgi:hypothetical protein